MTAEDVRRVAEEMRQAWLREPVDPWTLCARIGIAAGLEIAAAWLDNQSKLCDERGRQAVQTAGSFGTAGREASNAALHQKSATAIRALKGDGG